MGDGSTLTTFAQLYPGKSVATLVAVTPRCRRDPNFGSTGEARIRIPSRLVRAHKDHGLSDDYLWINALAARIGGGALIAGIYRSRWVVGALDPRGRLDSQFGTKGWTALPLRGGVSAILQEPSGRIVVAGDNGGADCCVTNHVAALSSSGRVDHHFGEHGHATLPTGEGARVASVSLEPNGDILTHLDYGNMGCWGVKLAMLTPAGRPVKHFAQRLRRFWRRVDFGAFLGDVYVDHGGFTLVGTGQKPCASRRKYYPAKSAHGVVARFQSNGVPRGRTVRFPSKALGGTTAFKVGAETLVVESANFDDAHRTLRLLHRDGSADKSFGNKGRAQLRSPGRSRDAAIDTEVSFTRAGRRSLAITAARYGRKQLQVIRVHY